MTFHWLVEAIGPQYLSVSSLHHQFHWSANANAALQMATREQAEALRDAVREIRPELFPDAYPMPQAVEHGWVDGDSTARENAELRERVGVLTGALRDSRIGHDSQCAGGETFLVNSDECNCGAEKHNARIDAALSPAAKEGG